MNVVLGALGFAVVGCLYGLYSLAVRIRKIEGTLGELRLAWRDARDRAEFTEDRLDDHLMNAAAHRPAKVTKPKVTKTAK
jgi:hypothetical protein